MQQLNGALPADAGERRALLAEAADALDALEVEMGPGGDVEPTGAGNLAREFASDIAEPKRPLLELVPAEAVDRSRDDHPVATESMLERFRFYWMTLPVKLYASAGW